MPPDDELTRAWSIPLPELGRDFESLRAEKDRVDQLRKDLAERINGLNPIFRHRLKAEKGEKLLILDLVAFRASGDGRGLERFEIDWSVLPPPGPPQPTIPD